MRQADDTRATPPAKSQLSRVALAAAVGAALLTVPYAAALLSLSRGWDWDFSDVPFVVVEFGPLAWLAATVTGLGLGVLQLLRPSQRNRLPAIAAALGALSLLVIVPLTVAAARSDDSVVEPESVQPASLGHSVWVLEARGIVLASSDGGAAWASHSTLQIMFPWRLAFADPRTGWAVGKGREVMSTVDGGATWSTSRSKGRGNLKAIACVDEDHAWAVGGKGPSRDRRPIVAATRDGGESWTTQTVAGRGDLSDVAFADSRHGWALGVDMEHRWGNYIVATNDGGRQWQVQYRVSNDEMALSDVAFADARHGWAVGTLSNGHRLRDDTGVILATDDGGATWKVQFEAPRPLSSVDCADAQHAWVAGQDGLILATSDGGGTWTAQPSGTTESLGAIAFSDSNHGWMLVGQDALLATSDGGATWQLVELGGDVYFTDVAAVRAE